MSRPHIAILPIFLAAALLLLAVKLPSAPRVTHDPAAPGTTHYTLPVHLALFSAAASLLLFTSAALFATTPRLLSRIFSLLPALFALMLAGAAYDVTTSHVTLTPSSLTLPAVGFPFRRHPTTALTDIRSARVDTASRELQLTTTDGSTLTFPLGDLTRAALPDLLDTFFSHHIPVAVSH